MAKAKVPVQPSNRVRWIHQLVYFVFLAVSFLLSQHGFAEKKPATIDFEDENTGVAPAKLFSPIVSPFDESKGTGVKDFLILSAKGSKIVVSVPNARDELKIGSILVLKDKSGARIVRFKVTKLSNSKVVATLQDKISNEVRNSLMGRTVTLQSATQANESE